MPDTGTLDRTSVAATSLATRPDPLVFEDARWAQITYEVSRQAAMERLPGEVTRPIPCYARLIAIDGVVEGAPANLAAWMVGGRFRMMPRNVLSTAVASGPFADGFLTNGLSLGEVDLRRDGAHVQATVALDGVTLMACKLPAIYAVEPTMLRWDPWLCIANEGGGSVLTEIAVTPTATAAFLSKGASLVAEAALPRTHSWRELANLLTISACYAEGTITLGVPQVVQECS